MDRFLLLLIYWCSLQQGSSTVKDEVSAVVGDSVTLYSDAKSIDQDRIMWYFNFNRIALINENRRKICTDVQCPEIFRDKLKLDHQTGSLTITNISITDSGEYKLLIYSSSNNSEMLFGVSVRAVPDVRISSAKEGESVTFDPAATKKQNYLMTWLFKDTVIAEISGDQSQICSGDRCKERFQDRLKVNHSSGSLTITNTRNTDAGDYQLQINSGRSSIIKSFSFTVTAKENPPRNSKVICLIVLLAVAAAAAAFFYRLSTLHSTRSVPVTKGGPVTLKTHFFDEVRKITVKKGESVVLTAANIKLERDDRIMWRFGDKELIIAEIGGINWISYDLAARFKNRLKVNYETGSLTVINTRSKDSGHYKLQINKSGEVSVMSFIVSVIGDARSTNRLKVDQQTGSLTITDTKTSDTGDYKFKISGNNNAVNLFIVVVYSSQPRHHTAAFYFNKVIGLIASYVNVVVVVMLVAGGITACVIYCCHVRPARKEHNGTTGLSALIRRLLLKTHLLIGMRPHSNIIIILGLEKDKERISISRYLQLVLMALQVHTCLMSEKVCS